MNSASGSASIIGAAQSMRIMQTATLGQTIHAMGMANCGDVNLSECATQASINIFREGLVKEGKNSDQQIDEKIAYLKANTQFFEHLGAYNAAILETNGGLEGLTQVKRTLPEPAEAVTDPNAITEVVVNGDKWTIMRQSLYGIGETMGKAVNTTDAMLQDGMNAVLNSAYGAPLRWGFGKIAEAAKAYPEVANVLNKPEELKEALGTGGAAVLMGDKYAPMKNFVDAEGSSLPAYEQAYHESISQVADGYAWVVGTLGAGALVYAAKAVSFTRVAADGTKFNNGEGDFYKTERALDTTKITRLQLYGILREHNVTLKDGWTADRLYDEVLSIPKPNRPTPDKYLSAEYIAAKLAEFDSGVVRVTTKVSVEKRSTLSNPNGDAFVMPKSEWDRISKLCDGDPRKLEVYLGFKENDLGDRENVYAALLDKNDSAAIKIPTGNEDGANEFWAPGIQTSGGVTEGLLTIPSTAITRSTKLNF